MLRPFAGSPPGRGAPPVPAAPGQLAHRRQRVVTRRRLAGGHRAEPLLVPPSATSRCRWTTAPGWPVPAPSSTAPPSGLTLGASDEAPWGRSWSWSTGQDALTHVAQAAGIPVDACPPLIDLVARVGGDLPAVSVTRSEYERCVALLVTAGVTAPPADADAAWAAFAHIRSGYDRPLPRPRRADRRPGGRADHRPAGGGRPPGHAVTHPAAGRLDAPHAGPVSGPAVLSGRPRRPGPARPGPGRPAGRRCSSTGPGRAASAGRSCRAGTGHPGAGRRPPRRPARLGAAPTTGPCRRSSGSGRRAPGPRGPRPWPARGGSSRARSR